MDEHARDKVTSVTSPRYYPSVQCLLPADREEAARLDAQHLIIVQAFENWLSLAPLKLVAGDKVQQEAVRLFSHTHNTGSYYLIKGIWALEFSAENDTNGVKVDIECIGLSSKQFPPTGTYTSKIHFSVHSIISLPLSWTNTFAYAHQRLIVLALNDSLWRQAIAELYRVLQPGGYLELVEFKTKRFHCGVGPSFNKLWSLVDDLFVEKGIIQGVLTYLCPLLGEMGFVNVRCQVRDVPVGGRQCVFQSGAGYTGEKWGEGWMGVKVPVVKGGGYGVVNMKEEFDVLLGPSAAIQVWWEVYTGIHEFI
ncbi:hypothetical protein EV359DRAFT_65198 [Lentinula novae-zelandiae]|nr:hypothetical protein EV359DRAFT_65198 [Lentinula novae-zelandiae]